MGSDPFRPSPAGEIRRRCCCDSPPSLIVPADSSIIIMGTPPQALSGIACRRHRRSIDVNRRPHLSIYSITEREREGQRERTVLDDVVLHHHHSHQDRP